MTALPILFSAATAGAAGAAAAACLLFWRMRPRSSVLGWFALVAGLHAVFACMHALRAGAQGLAMLEVALRVNSLVGSLFALALLRLYHALTGAPAGRVDRVCAVLLWLAAAYGLLSPAGFYLARLDGIDLVDLGVLGQVSRPRGAPDPGMVLISGLYLACLCRLLVLAWRGGRPGGDRGVLLLVPLALLVPVIHGLGLARGWWGGIPLGEYAMTAVFLLLCFELARRERGVMAELRDREAKLSALVEHGQSFAGLLDPDGRVVLANRTALRAVGARAEDVIGHPFPDTPWWTHREADRLRLRAAIARAAAGESDHFLTSHRLSDGRLADIDFSITPFLRDGALRYLIVEGRDVSELRRYEERLREGGKFEAIGQLAGGIAHDFNNVLGGIMGAAELALVDADPQTQRRLNTILSATSKAADLTRQLLSFARRGKVQDVIVPFNDLIEETLVLAGRGSGPAIAIERRLAAAPDRVSGDPAELQSAILNLCVNARDAMPDGGTLVVSTRNQELDASACAGFAQVVEPGAYIALEISDSGCGMTPEVQARIFEPFFTTKEPGKGTGLGMPAVLGTVLAHRGAMLVVSRPGAGTTVTVWLPASVRAAPPPAIAESPRRRAGRGLVVVVDDEPLQREQASELLSGMGFAVEAFADPLLARERLRESEGVRCVVLDLAMPRLDGRVLYRHLRASSPGLPVVICSGYAGGAQLLDGSDDPHLRFLAKPWRERQLRQVLAELGVLAAEPVTAGA